MPIYEYKCQDCGSKFEALRIIKDADTPIQCDKCQSTKTHRIASSFSTKFAGKPVSSGNNGCGDCSGGSCASCGH